MCRCAGTRTAGGARIADAGCAWRPRALCRRPARRGGQAIRRPAKYVCLDSLEALDPWIDAAFEAGFVCFDTETDSLDPMQANLVGVSWRLRRIAPAIFRFGHKAAADDLFGGGSCRRANSRCAPRWNG